MKSQLLKSNQGKIYKLVMPGDPAFSTGRLNKALNPVRFDDVALASQFLRNLSAPPSLWFKLANLQDNPVRGNARIDLEAQISRMLINGRVSFYEVSGQLAGGSATESTKIKGGNNKAFEFAPVGVLLTNSEAKAKKFSSKSEAAHFIDELGPEPKELKAIAKELQLPIAETSNAEYEQLVDAIAEELNSGRVVTLESTEENRTEMKNEESGSSSDESAPREQHTLGPHVGAGATAAVLAASPAVAEEKPVECGTCTVSSFDVSCKHGRKAGISGKLRVVPSQDIARTKSIQLMGVQVKIKEECGGKEDIDYAVKLDGAKRSDCEKVKSDKGWEAKSKSNLILKGETSEELDIWPIDARPKTYTVSGKGCSGPEGEVSVELYPNQKYTIEGNLDIFSSWVDGINKAWKDWGEKIFSYSPVSLEPKLSGPKGSFSASWGWKEDSDWKAYFDFSASFGLNPILGAELEIALSVVKLLGTAAGVPPVMSKLAADHLADILFKASAGCAASLMGSPHGKKYPDESFLVSGDAKFSAEGFVKLGFKVRIGSDKIVSVGMSATGETKLKGEDTLNLDRNGLTAQTTIVLEPLTATIIVEYKYLVVFTKTKEKKWTPWKTMDLYKSDVKKILPR